MGLGKTYSTKYLLDSNNSSGVAGQVLSTTSTGIDWVDANTVPGSGLWLENGNDIYNSNSGNVGIGTDSPGTDLEIGNGTGSPGLTLNKATTGTASLFFDNGGNNKNWIKADAAESLIFGTNNSTNVTIKEGGNVGIGTTTPVETFTVPGSKGAMLGFKRFYSDTGTVPAGIGSSYTLTANLNDEQGTTLTSQYQYKFYLTTTGTGTYNSSVYIVYRNSADTVWDVHRVSSTGLTSNHPELTISGNNALIYNDHPNAYGVYYRVETSYTGQAKTSPEIFGSDYMWTRDFNNLHYMGGSVGIGTTNPQAKLHVNTSGTTKFIGTNADYVANSVGSGVLITTGASTGNTYSQIYGFQSGNTQYANLVVPGGNVGIGTTVTSDINEGKLYVNGTLALDQTSEIKYGKNNGGPYLNVRSKDSGTSACGIKIHSPYGSPGYFYGEGSGSGSSSYIGVLDGGGNWALQIRTGTSTSLWANGSNRLHIDSAGNVGIGTTSPSAKLEIAGTVKYDTQLSTNVLTGQKAFIGISSGSGAQKFKIYKNTNTTDGYARFKIDRAFDYGNSDQMVQEAIFQRRNTTKNFVFRYDGDIATGDDVYLEVYELSNGQVEIWLCVDDYAQPVVEVISNPSTSEIFADPSAGTPTGTLIHSSNPDTETPNWNSRQGVVTATTFLGDLNGTINTATTGTTQTAGNNSTKIATTAYADAAAAAVPIGNYLPLSAGSSYPLTGILYLGNVGSDQKIQFQRTGGNVYSIEHDSAKLYFYNRTTTEAPLVIQNDGDVLLNGGNVGIGTTSPSAKLHVNSENSEGTLIISRGGNNLATNNNVGSITFPADYAGTPTNYAKIKAYANALSGVRGSLDFNVKSTSGALLTGMTVYGTSSGVNVGIGTTTPVGKLNVALPADSNGNVASWSSNQVVFTRGGTSTSQGLGFSVHDVDNSATISSLTPAVTWSDLNYRAKNHAFYSNGVTLGIYQNISGNVGIGTTGPGAKLEVVDNNNYAKIGDLQGDSTMLLRMADNASFPVEVQAYGSELRFNTATTSGATPSVKMNVLANGNVGIGDTNPVNNLSVVGSIGTDDIFMTATAASSSGTAFVVNEATQLVTRTAAQVLADIGAAPATGGSYLPLAGGTMTGNTTFSGNKAIILQNQSNNNQYYIRNSGGTNATFQVGQGAPGSNVRFFINGSGNVGIGNTASTASVKLEVTGNTLLKNSNGVGDLYLGNYATANHFRFHTNNANTYFDMNCGDIYWRQGTSTRYTFFPTTANMTVNGTITQLSDIRNKENIVEISDCISKVQAMRGVYYNRTDFNTEVTKVGVIAQEVEAVLPELVLESPETGLKSVAYSELTSVLINAIKEQQEIIEDLKTRITKLEN